MLEVFTDLLLGSKVLDDIIYIIENIVILQLNYRGTRRDLTSPRSLIIP